MRRWISLNSPSFDWNKACIFCWDKQLTFYIDHCCSSSIVLNRRQTFHIEQPTAKQPSVYWDLHYNYIFFLFVNEKYSYFFWCLMFEGWFVCPLSCWLNLGLFFLLRYGGGSFSFSNLINGVTERFSTEFELQQVKWSSKSITSEYLYIHASGCQCWYFIL